MPSRSLTARRSLWLLRTVAAAMLACLASWAQPQSNVVPEAQRELATYPSQAYRNLELIRVSGGSAALVYHRGYGEADKPNGPSRVPVARAADVPSPVVLASASDIDRTLAPAVIIAREHSVRIPRISDVPSIQDFASGAYGGFAQVGAFRQRIPLDGAPASEETRAYLGFDDTSLYVAFVCKDDPKAIRAHLAKREQVRGEDLVAVYLDTFHDSQRAYSFTANPLGVQRDAVKYEGVNEEDANFDTIWQSEGVLTADGYVVLITIPFKSLRFAGGAEQSWGIALRRHIIRNNEDAYWPYITNREQAFVPQFATAYGISEVSHGRNIQLIPYVSGAATRLLADSGSEPYHATTTFRAGLDTKFVIKDALTVDATINPDFSQVESDDPQATVNQRFEVVYPDKRPFFTENANYFETPINLFFSRRIVDPTGGVRVTGKVGGWAVGALAADDRSPILQQGGRSELVDGHAQVGVVRLQREFGGSTRLGGLFTTHNWNGGSNHVVAMDGRVQLSSKWFLSGQAAQSLTSRDGETDRVGAAFDASLTRAGRGVVYTAGYTDLSPDFRTDVGFLKRTDLRTGSQYLSYRWWPETGALQSFGPSATALVNYDHEGRLQDWYVEGGFDFQFKRNTTLTLGRSEAYEYFERGFRRERSSVSLFSGFTKWLAVYGQFGYGTGVNYSPGPGLSAFLADAQDASFTVTLRPSTRLRWDGTYIYGWLGRPEAVVAAQTGQNGAVYTNHVVRNKINYQFTRRWSLRFIADYFAVLPNSRLISQYDFKRLSGDVLLEYLATPGTALYLGYTDRYDNLYIDPLDPIRRGLSSSPTTSTGRQVFIKVSRVLRY